MIVSIKEIHSRDIFLNMKVNFKSVLISHLPQLASFIFGECSLLLFSRLDFLFFCSNHKHHFLDAFNICPILGSQSLGSTCLSYVWIYCYQIQKVQLNRESTDDDSI